MRAAGYGRRHQVVVVTTDRVLEQRRRNVAAMRRVWEATQRRVVPVSIPAPRQARPTSPVVELQPVT